jgi:hypothetical protein
LTASAALNQPVGLACLAGLVLEQSQKMKRVEMIALENARKDFLGACKVTLAVQGDRLFEHLREVRCDGFRHGRTIGRRERGCL